MLRSVIVLCACVTFSSAGLLRQSDEETLVFVTIVFRHGDRTPIATYPNDPHNLLNASIWKEKPGHLTNLGKQQQYTLGKWIRQRYHDFLPEKYSVDDVYVRCTDVDRTLMSAAVNLAGLYTPGDDNWSDKIPWQPIPIHSLPEVMDHVVAAKKPCPKYDKLQNELLSAELSKMQIKYEKDLKYISENSGATITRLETVKQIWDALFIEDLKGMEHPKWAESIYPHPLVDIVNRWAEIPCDTPEMARFKIGPMMKEILDRFERKISGSVPQKMWIYSAHDTTLAALLKGLNIFDAHIPPYCSILMFELWENHGEHYVKIYYRNSTAVDPHLMKLPECYNSCLLTKFKEIVHPILPDDWEKECQL